MAQVETRLMKTYSISNLELVHFLKPKDPSGTPSYELDLSAVFCDILRRANDFVPSEAGSIFLKDLTEDSEGTADVAAQEGVAGDDGKETMLVVAASFGEHAQRLAGTRLPVERGIAGHVFRTGEAYVSREPAQDERFFSAVDRLTGFTTRSVICLPLTVERDVVGVLQLINRRDGEVFTQRELELLEIFAQTISVSVANAIEAQRAREMARRDDLTRLFNDRYMHYRLSQVLEESVAGGQDCGVIFFDLDHFKNVNDTFGHLAGSRVLAEVGDILRQVLPGHSVGARYGGDEFVIILPESGHQEVYWAAETVRKSIEKHVFLERPDPADPKNNPALEIRGVVTCSAGLGTLHGDLQSLLLPGGSGKAMPVEISPVKVKNELLRIADRRMYRAKEQGKNRTMYADPPVIAVPEQAG